jgi:hypothetical protein
MKHVAPLINYIILTVLYNIQFCVTQSLQRWLSSGLLRLVVWWKVTNVSAVLTASIIRVMMKATSTSETLENFYQPTRRYKPEDRHFYTRRRKNLISRRWLSPGL